VRSGGLVAYPTEAVWGLGCLPLHRDAVERLLALKQRSWRKGFLLIAAGFEQLEPFVVLPANGLRENILASWPGPQTWTLPAKPHIPTWLTGGRPTLAVRVTAHSAARRLCETTGQALISTSANLSRRRPLRRVLAVRRVLGHALDDILPGSLGSLSAPTPIRDGQTGDLLRRSP